VRIVMGAADRGKPQAVSIKDIVRPKMVSRETIMRNWWQLGGMLDWTGSYNLYAPFARAPMRLILTFLEGLLLTSMILLGATACGGGGSSAATVQPPTEPPPMTGVRRRWHRWMVLQSPPTSPICTPYYGVGPTRPSPHSCNDSTRQSASPKTGAVD
jgi:hypothetical protein